MAHWCDVQKIALPRVPSRAALYRDISIQQAAYLAMPCILRFAGRRSFCWWLDIVLSSQCGVCSRNLGKLQRLPEACNAAWTRWEPATSKTWAKKMRVATPLKTMFAQVTAAAAFVLKLSARPESEAVGPEITNTRTNAGNMWLCPTTLGQERRRPEPRWQ